MPVKISGACGIGTVNTVYNIMHTQHGDSYTLAHYKTGGGGGGGGGFTEGEELSKTTVASY